MFYESANLQDQRPWMGYANLNLPTKIKPTNKSRHPPRPPLPSNSPKRPVRLHLPRRDHHLRGSRHPRQTAQTNDSSNRDPSPNSFSISSPDTSGKSATTTESSTLSLTASCIDSTRTNTSTTACIKTSPRASSAAIRICIVACDHAYNLTSFARQYILAGEELTFEGRGGLEDHHGRDDVEGGAEKGIYATEVADECQGY